MLRLLLVFVIEWWRFGEKFDEIMNGKLVEIGWCYQMRLKAT